MAGVDRSGARPEDSAVSSALSAEDDRRPARTEPVGGAHPFEAPASWHMAAAQRIAEIGSWEADEGTWKLRCSEEVYRICGITVEDSDGTVRSWLNYVHPEDRKAVVEMLNRISRTDQRLDVTHRIVRPNGDVRWVRQRAEQATGPTGRPMFLGTTQDITDIRLAEDERHRLSASVASSDHLLSMAGRLAKMGGWIVREPWVSVEWSAETALVHQLSPGYSPSLYEGIGFYAPEWRDRISQAFMNCREQSAPWERRWSKTTASWQSAERSRTSPNARRPKYDCAERRR